MKGIKRFRQAIKNQRDAGEGEFHLTYHDADEIADEIEEEFESLSWAAGVPVPKDADDEVVPLTTKVMYGDDGRELEIILFKFNIDNYATHWMALCKNKDGNTGYAAVSNIHLRRPDSWEKLEEDVQKVKETGDICGYYDNVGKLYDECPARNIPGMCSAIVLRDALRRAKALADRDAKGSTPQPSPHGVKEADCG